MFNVKLVCSHSFVANIHENNLALNHEDCVEAWTVVDAGCRGSDYQLVMMGILRVYESVPYDSDYSTGFDLATFQLVIVILFHTVCRIVVCNCVLLCAGNHGENC